MNIARCYACQGHGHFSRDCANPPGVKITIDMSRSLLAKVHDASARAADRREVSAGAAAGGARPARGAPAAARGRGDPRLGDLQHGDPQHGGARSARAYMSIASALTAARAAHAAAGPTPMLNATAAGLCSREGAVAAGPVATASSVFAAAEPVAAAKPRSTQPDLWLRPAPTSSEADGMTAANMHSVQRGSCAALRAATLSNLRPAANSAGARASIGFSAGGRHLAYSAERAATAAAVLHGDGFTNALGASPPAAGHVAASNATRPMAATSASIASALTAAGAGAAADAAAGPAPMLGAAAAGLCSQEGAVTAGPVATASSVLG